MTPGDMTGYRGQAAHPARVLVAKDDPADRELMAALRERLGYRAGIAAGADEFLACFRDLGAAGDRTQGKDVSHVNV